MTLLLSCYVNNSISNIVYLYKYIQIGIFIYVFSVLLPYTGKYKEYFIIVIALLCLYESILGLFQIIRFLKTEYCMFPCIGSFNNPGPYGGFLATCSSILIAYTLKGSNKTIKAICAYSLLPVTIVLPVTMSRAAFLGFGLSVVCLLFSVKKYRKLFQKFWYLFATISLVLCAALFYLKRSSADGRFLMNHISAIIISSNGLFGGGLGNFAGQYGNMQTRYFKQKMMKGDDWLDWTAIRDRDRLSADCPEFAYNEYLQLGVECGPLCMLCFIGVLVISMYWSRKQHSVWLYGLLCFSIFAVFSYPLDSILFRLILSFMLVESKPANNLKRLKLFNLAFAIGFIFFYYTISPQLKHETETLRLMSTIKKWFKIERYDYVIEDCENILGDVHIADYYYMYGKSLNEVGKYHMSDSVLLLGTKISSDPMFWNVMGNNSLALGRYREAEERYKHAFYMVPNRLYPLTLLAKLYHTEGDTVRFLDMAEKVETFVPKIENANTERLRAEIREIREGYNIEAIKKDEEQ